MIAYLSVEDVISPSGVELSSKGNPCRMRLSPIKDFSAETLLGLISETVEPSAQVIPDGWSGYFGIENYIREKRIIEERPALEIMARIHRMYSNLKRWALGVYHGLRRKHI